MPRNGPATRRELAPDPVYRSVLVTQVVNKVLSRGKRTLAERIVYGALTLVEERAGRLVAPGCGCHGAIVGSPGSRYH